jgi:hypothetical protein
MATFTLAANQNWEDAVFSTRAGNDAYNLSGYRLTVSSDTRYSVNATATTGNIGSFTVSASLGGELYIDGTSVRIIPFTGSSGVVPAIGETATEGGVTAYFLGVWSALNAAPTAAGAAWPASGWIKVKNKAGGNFSAGSISFTGGATATATGADVVGWIEVVAIESGTGTVNRLGKCTMRGAWFDVGTTSGSSNQTIQMPASLANTYYPGVWISKTTTPATDADYEFYPNVGGATTTRQDIGGKVCWISSQGLLRIGNSGAATNGYTPIANLKIRVPNIITLNAVAASAVNAAPNIVLATRFDFTCTGGGQIDWDIANICWYPSFTQAFDVKLTNVAIADQLQVQELASPVAWSQIGVGITTVLTTISNPLLMLLDLAGGTITDCVWTRPTLAASGTYVNSVTDVKDFTFTRNVSRSAALRGNATAGTWSITRASDCTWTDCDNIGGTALMTTCVRCTWTNPSYLDSPTTTTATGVACYAFSFQTGCDTIKVDGLDFMGLANSNPYSGPFTIGAGGGNNFKFRNMGTAGSPLSLGPTNASAYLLLCAANCGAKNVELKRLYTVDNRTGLISIDNSVTGLILENVWGDTGDTLALAAQNVQARGVRNTYAGAVQTGAYGTHFADVFTSGTVGRVVTAMNERSTVLPSSASYEPITVGTGCGFNSAGLMVSPNVSDEYIWTHQSYILGHKSFATTIPTLTAANANNHDWYYQIDRGGTLGGYGGSWLNLLYRRTGGATTSTSFDVTMTSTAGVALGDYVYGTNIPADTIVVEITNGTTLKLSKAATGTGSSYVFTFNHLPATGFATLTFGSSSYVNCIVGDIGKAVVYTGGTPTDTGTLIGYNNTTRTWYVQRTVNTAAFSNTSTAISITSGTGGGTLSVAATLDPVIDASVGFKLKERMVTNTAATTNTITAIYLATITDSTALAYQYPLDYVTLRMEVKNEAGTGLNGIEVYIDDDNVVPYILETTTATVGGVDGVAEVSYGGGAVAGSRWRARKYGYKQYQQIINIGSASITLPVTLVVDPQQT